MTEDELIALYGSVKEMAAAMKAREAALAAKTSALDAAIAELKQIPGTLGKQTSQYIAAGVRQSIQDDFSRPIADAVKGPIAQLSRETYHAREVMAQVGKRSPLPELELVCRCSAHRICDGWGHRVLLFRPGSQPVKRQARRRSAVNCPSDALTGCEVGGGEGG